MKYLTFLLFIPFVTLHGLSAQNIHFPDPNFKQALIDEGVDTGNDGEISQSEAMAVTSLIVSNKTISDLTGIRYFTNLNFLNCSDNSLMSLDVSGLANLRLLYCDNNSLTSLDVNGLANLEGLSCDLNGLTTLDVSGLTNLIVLSCLGNSLASLDVSELTKLKQLICFDNSLTNLDVSGLTKLEQLQCFDNSLTSLDVSGLTKLNILNCPNNTLYSIDIRNTPALNILAAYNNSDLECIVVDDVNVLPGTTYVDMGFNNFTTEPCVGSFEGLPILVKSVGLTNATEAALLATLKIAEEACSIGNKWMAVSSLTTFALMTNRAQQLGRLSDGEANQLIEASDILVGDIQSGFVDCSSGTPPDILDWISSWFSLDAEGQSAVPDAGTTISGYSGSKDIPVSHELRIYPNPTAGRVDFSSAVNQVEVYNMMGKLMKKAVNVNHLDLHTYQAGVYVIRMIDDKGERSVHRVVKK